MKIEVLVTTMHQKDFSKYNDMNLQTDAVIANQADYCGFEETEIDGKRVRFVTTDTRGASVNRNIAITYSTADIVVFSDDDQQFVDGYEELIINEFQNHPDADVIKFYCESSNPERPFSYKKPQFFCRATKRNIMSAGVHCLAVKRECLIKNNIFFNVSIGPGNEIYSGEDSVFLNDMITNKVSIYLSPALLSYVSQGESSWFKGYDEQFFTSCGYVYACIYGLLAPLVIIRRAIKTRKRKKCTTNIITMIKLMLKGFLRGLEIR